MLIGHAIEILYKYELAGTVDGGEYYLKTAYFVVFEDAVRLQLSAAFACCNEGPKPGPLVATAREIAREYMRQTWPKGRDRVAELIKPKEATDDGQS